ncbi:thioredoxin protein [Salix suchowensis]|nr:thioredoxin protein [Salix suchowensis]
MIEPGQSWDFYVTGPVLLYTAVHFTAPWCQPSVAMNPIFEDLASAYPDVLFLTVYVDGVRAENKHLVVSNGDFILVVIDMKDHHH